jgi:hypothetical protein
MRHRSFVFRFFLAFVFAALFSHPAFSQYSNQVLPGPGWQVMRADWGAGNRWRDVTSTVRILLSGNGMVQVNNQNMGGDPAVGADKILRIQARNYQGQSRQFTFKEGSSIDASQFYSYGGGIGPGNPGNPGWQVMFADWGAGNRRTDVTQRVRVLLSGNGMVRVNNQNLGVDPWKGADKVLRISARDARGQVKQFTYKEGANIDASQFYNYGGYPGGPAYPGPGGPGPGKPPRPGPGPGPGNGSLQIVRAYWGLNNRTSDVTRILQGQVQPNGTLVIQANNQSMGGDPAVGADKVLTVIYRYNGREQTATVKEGNTLRIP